VSCHASVASLALRLAASCAARFAASSPGAGGAGAGLGAAICAPLPPDALASAIAFARSLMKGSSSSSSFLLRQLKKSSGIRWGYGIMTSMPTAPGA
jgi:hypothetical protein